MELHEIVQQEAKKQGISGVLEMASFCGLSYPRTVRVWKGHTNGTFADVKTVLESLNLSMTVSRKNSEV